MFSKIVELCKCRGFLCGSDLLKIGPLGVLLKEILKTEWLNFHVTNKDVSIFLNENSGDLAETLDFVKNLYNGQFPFGIAEIIENGEANFTNNSNGIKFENCFPTKSLLRCTIFLAPSMSTQFFHQWQRQRRIWWRKFSASPDRYCFNDITNNGSDHQSVDILAKYQWEDQIVENISLNTALPLKLSDKQLEVKNGKKNVIAHHVMNEINLSTMVLNTICDAYEEPIFKGVQRPLLHFHRKIAPIKLSFAITASQLQDLALYLCKLLKNQNIPTLLIPNSHKINLDSLWKQFDEMGVPYNVYLNEESLKNGIILLRNRDTTLKEQIHVTQFVDYIEKIFKNY